MSASRRRSILPVRLFLFFACFSLSAIAARDRPHQPPYREIELDHVDFDSMDFGSQEQAATAVTPFCKSFTFLCHIRCLQRGDPQNPDNGPSASSAQTSEINRCNHVPNTHKMQVLCLCNNGMDLTAEIDYALEGVVDIAAAGGDGTGPGEAGKIREVVYAATLTVTQSVYKTVTLTSTTTMPALPAVTTTLVEYKTITITAAAAAQTAEPALTIETPAAVLTPAATKESMGKSSFPMSESDHVSIDPVETENQESQVFEGARGAATSDDVQPQLNEGPYGSFNEATWEVDPDAYQDPYLKEEFIEPIDDEQQAYEDEAEVEAEGEIEPLGNADHEDNLEDAVEENINLERQKHKSHDEDDDREDDNEDRDEEDDDRHKHKHIVDYEDMFPPFDIESEPLPKHTPHKHSHDDDKDKKKHHDRDRDESEDDDEEEEGDDDEDGDEDDVDEEEDDVDEDNDSLSRQ